MARLYANENFPLPVVDELRKAGHDVLTSAESGRAGKAIPDEEVLQYAAKENRTLMTMNRLHFIRLHKQKPQHSGIIVCTVDPDFKALASRIDVEFRASQNMAKRLVRINRPDR